MPFGEEKSLEINQEDSVFGSGSALIETFASDKIEITAKTGIYTAEFWIPASAGISQWLFLRAEERERGAIETLENLQLLNSAGQPVPLTVMATLRVRLPQH
jgi:hypothetical protein